MTISTNPSNLSPENLKEELRQEIEAFAPQDFESQQSRHHLFGKLLKLKGAKSSGNFGSDPGGLGSRFGRVIRPAVRCGWKASTCQ